MQITFDPIYNYILYFFLSLLLLEYMSILGLILISLRKILNKY